MIRLRARLAGGDREWEFPGGRVVIGRAPDCDLVVDDARVSRRHAELRLEHGQWILADLGTANGTFMGGERIERRPIAVSDVFTLGREVGFEVLAAGGASSGPARPAEDEPALPSTRERGPSRRAAGGAREGQGRAFGPQALTRILVERRWWLLPLDSDEGLRIPGPIALLGREHGAAVRLDAPSVSRVHARLEPKHDHVLVTDLKSRAGTRVNGQTIVHGEARDGDEIEFGAVGFRLEREDAPALGRIALLAAGLAVTLALAIGGACIANRAPEAGGARHAGERFVLVHAAPSDRS